MASVILLGATAVTNTLVMSHQTEGRELILKVGPSAPETLPCFGDGRFSLPRAFVRLKLARIQAVPTFSPGCVLFCPLAYNLPFMFLIVPKVSLVF